MSGPEERRRAVDLYSATPMTTAQVVEHLGHPTRQCPERWLAKDPRHAGHMAKPTIPLETKDQGDRTGAGRHARKRAAGRFGAVCFVKFLWAVSAFLLVRLSGCF